MSARSRRADDAMADLARHRGAALAGYAYLLTGDLRDAEDLVQDALVKTFVRGAQIEPVAAESYVRRAILSLFIDGYRRRRHWDGVRHLLVRGEEQAGHEARSAQRVDVQTALQALAPQQRACVVLRYFEDLTTREIADRLGVGDGTVKRYLSLAVHRMETLLGPLDDRPGEADDVVLVETTVLVQKTVLIEKGDVR